MLNFFGIEKVDVVSADQMALDYEKSIKDAEAQIENLLYKIRHNCVRTFNSIRISTQIFSSKFFYHLKFFQLHLLLNWAASFSPR